MSCTWYLCLMWLVWGMFGCQPFVVGNIRQGSGAGGHVFTNLFLIFSSFGTENKCLTEEIVVIILYTSVRLGVF